MGLFEKLLGRKNPNPARASDEKKDSELIRIFDEFGRELFLTRHQWRTSVLPGMLASNRDKPEQLSQIIIGALQDGFFSEVLEAAKALYQRDPASAHATCIYGITLTQTQHLGEAERIFDSYLHDHGEDAAVLTNLAKVYAARNQTERVDPTLWRALEADPNFDNGFAWYVARRREQDGPASELAALQRLAAMPGSWRSQLWQARGALDAGSSDQAMDLYRAALSHAGDQISPDLLAQISGDLGQHGRLRELLQFVEPLFVPESHGLQVGNNLLKANLDLGRIDRARWLLDQLREFKRPDWKDGLDFWDTEIAKAQISRANPSVDALSKLELVDIEGPVWLGSESLARNLFGGIADDAPIVCFVGSSVELPHKAEEPHYQIADAPGQLSRAVPLLLAEQVQFMTGARAHTLIPWASEGAQGFVVGGAASTDDGALKCAAQVAGGSEFVIVSHLRVEPDLWSIRLRVVGVKDAQCIEEFNASFPPNHPEEAIPDLAAALISLLVRRADVGTRLPPPLYQLPTDVNFANYLLRLEQLLSTRCAAMEGVTATFLHGEREILDGNLQLCLACPDNAAVRVLFAETLLAMKRIRPDVVGEFRDKVFLLQDRYPLQEPAQGVLSQMLA